MMSKVTCIEDHVFYFTYRLISRFQSLDKSLPDDPKIVLIRNFEE